MVKAFSYTILSLLLLSCSAKKNKCETVTLDKTSTHHIEVQGDMSMYGYKVKEGNLKDYIFEVIVMNNGMELDAHLVHPTKPLNCEPYMREAWKVKETKDLEKRTVEMTGDISLKCGGKIYCFKTSYSGPFQQMPPMETH